jgi:trans-aconitate methyltransferase
MIHAGAAGLASWVRTTWMPYTDRIPQGLREIFIEEVVNRYLVSHPADAHGKVHLAMVRLEVEADKPLKEFGVQSA